MKQTPGAPGWLPAPEISPGQEPAPPPVVRAPPTERPPSMWRSGKTLIAIRNGILNDRCVRCNESVGPKLIKRTYLWHHPAIYLLIILASPLIYVIVAIIVRKKAVMHVGLCPRHRTRRWMHTLIALTLVAMSFFLMIASFPADLPGAFLAGLGLFIAALIYAVIVSPLLKARRIDDNYICLKGCCEAYLAELPAWPYPL